MSKTKIKLSIRILHYVNPNRPDRSKWVEIIKVMLNDPRVKVYTDNSGTPYGGLKNVFNDVAQDKPTHILLLHHDILPCFNFIPTVEKLIALKENEPISFYTNNRIVDEALKKNKHWIKLKIWFYTQAYTMPFATFEKAISWIEANINEDDRNSDDERLAMYFYFNKLLVNATVPSLVEHIGWNSTTVNYDRPLKGYLDNKDHRMARKFIGIDHDPLSINWNNGLNSPLISKEDWALENSVTLFQKLLKKSSKYKT